MNGFAEEHLKFFDSVVLFADFWKRSSNLTIDFTLTSSEETSKVVFLFEDEDKNETNLFFHHVLRHFFPSNLVSKISFIHPNSVELIMKK